MGILDMFKASENEQLKNYNEKLKKEIDELKGENNNLKQLLTPEHRDLVKLKEEIKRLLNDKQNIRNEIEEIKKEKEKIEFDIKTRKNDLVIMNEEILMQEFGIYECNLDLGDSEFYKNKINEIKNKQKAMIKDKSAVDFFDAWTVDGSKVKGRKMTNDNIKQILMAFNIECDNLIAKVKYNNIGSIEKRIEKTFERLNKINETNRVSLTVQYLTSRLEELELVYAYQVKKQEEKEEQKRIRAELREQAKIQKELEEARKNIIKDLTHFKNALRNIEDQLTKNDISEEERRLLELKKEELKLKIQDGNNNLKDIDYRQENQKAGYVYIISNIGSFGENVYKIGMTRRLDPMDRVNELGDASVPFKFDVHAMIFSEDAPKLENALHKAFDDKKVNMVNKRREFFKVTLDEIEQVVKANFDKTIEFKKIPEAEQFRISEKMR